MAGIVGAMSFYSRNIYCLKGGFDADGSLEMLHEPSRNLPKQMRSCVSSIYTMVSVGIEILLEILVGLHQGLCIFHRVLRVDVIVGQSVTNEQGTMEFVCALNGVGIIAGSVFFWRAHIAFRVDGVVVSPVGWWRNSYSCLEDRASFAHAHQRVEASEAPPPNAYPVFIDITLLAQP